MEDIKGRIDLCNLPKKYKDMLFFVMQENLDQKISLHPYQIYEMIGKAEDVYADALKLRADDLFIRQLFYQSIKRYSVKREDNVAISKKLMEETLFNPEMRAKIRLIECRSGFFLTIKALIPKIERLLKLMETKRSYLVLKAYKEILDFINLEAIPTNLTDREKEIELRKRYSIPYNKLSDYKSRMKEIEFPSESVFIAEAYTHAYNYSSVCNMVQRYLYDLMINHYKETGCFYRQLDASTGLFMIGDLNIVTYTNDSDAVMTLEQNYQRYTWADKEFWAIISDPQFKFKKNSISSKYTYGIRNKLGQKTIICPYEYMDEAFLRKLLPDGDYEDMYMDLITQDKLQKLGFYIHKKPTNKLITTDDSYYFKDPRIISELTYHNISKYPTLEKIVEKADIEEVSKYLTYLRSYVKGRKDTKKSAPVTIKGVS